MQYISATEAKQSLSKVLESSQRGPVVIQKQKRDVAVMLSMQEYRKLTALNLEDFERFCDLMARQAEENGLTQEKLEDIIVSQDDD